MNIEQAKTISISEILDKLNIKPTRKDHKEAWYLSPFRKERTASFHLHNKKNIWYDFGLGIGGDVIKFVSSYLESQKQSHSVSDALSWLDNIGDFTTTVLSQDIVTQKNNEHKNLIVKSVKQIKHRALIQYLEKRGIPLGVANIILKEVRVCISETNKNIFALGLQNEEDSYELRNPFFKGCAGTKSITFIRGKNSKPDGINIFEGFMDYLSIITQNEGRVFKDDTIILNSLSCYKKAFPYIKNYGYKTAFTWLDNDQPGKKATLLFTEFFKQEPDLIHKKMNRMYEPYKDVNAWHMHKLGL